MAVTCTNVYNGAVNLWTSRMHSFSLFLPVYEGRQIELRQEL